MGAGVTGCSGVNPLSVLKGKYLGIRVLKEKKDEGVKGKRKTLKVPHSAWKADQCLGRGGGGGNGAEERGWMRAKLIE